MHSLHAYFLRRGDFNAPIVYEVDRSRDGHSFSNRRVIAIQHGEQIFNMTASFQVVEDGLEHQIEMPQVPPPEELPDMAGDAAADDRPNCRSACSGFVAKPTAVRVPHGAAGRIFRTAKASRHRSGRCGFACRTVFRMASRCIDSCSRTCPTTTCSTRLCLPHGMSFLSAKAIMASIDHAMWFHRPLRVDDWLLYALDSPSASGARGFGRGSVFSRDGRLVASTAQEGLVRVVRALSDVRCAAHDARVLASSGCYSCIAATRFAAAAQDPPPEPSAADVLMQLWPGVRDSSEQVVVSPDRGPATFSDQEEPARAHRRRASPDSMARPARAVPRRIPPRQPGRPAPPAAAESRAGHPGRPPRPRISVHVQGPRRSGASSIAARSCSRSCVRTTSRRPEGCDLVLHQEGDQFRGGTTRPRLRGRRHEHREFTSTIAS